MTPPDDPLRVLVANDQEWAARSLESILVPEGFLVDRAYTGLQAYRHALEARPDVIVLDSQMPDISGPEVTARLRAEAGFDPTVPIIITTAGPAGRAERLRAFEAGAWEFFGQPFDGDTLLAKLRVFADTRRASRDLQRRLMVDAQTGLYTATGLAHRAAEIASEATREALPLACLVLRPRELGADTEEESGAQEFARGLANLFHRVGRRADAIGRLGPMDIGMIAPRTPETGVKSFLARMETAMREAANGMRGLAGGLRAGYCITQPASDSAPDPVDMLRRAGAAVRRTSAEYPVLAA